MGRNREPIQESSDLEASKNCFISTSKPERMRPERMRDFWEKQTNTLTGAEMFSQGTSTAQTNPTGKEL